MWMEDYTFKLDICEKLIPLASRYTLEIHSVNNENSCKTPFQCGGKWAVECLAMVCMLYSAIFWKHMMLPIGMEAKHSAFCMEHYACILG